MIKDGRYFANYLVGKMSAPLVCVECGYPLADVRLVYKAVLLKRVKAKGIGGLVRPEFVPAVEIHMNDVLNALGVKNPCCRSHMIAMQEKEDFY